jgi:RNA polymerase sigma factor (sigma-70 family)
MALQSIKRPITDSRRLGTLPQAVSAGSYVSRISPADELQLACRLAECRRELLAIALLDAESRSELERVATALQSGARRPSDVLDMMAGNSSPAAGLSATAGSPRNGSGAGSKPGAADLSPFSKGSDFETYVARVAAVQKEAALVLRAPEGHSAFGAITREALESLTRRMHEVVKSQPLATDLVDRLLQLSWTASKGHGTAASGLVMPPALRERVRQLDAEIETIRSRFIHANQGLVAYVVQRYRGMGLRRDDLMQEGNIGLLRAIEKFDHRRGTRFSVYAVWWIRQAVRRALANQSRTIRIPVHALAVRYAVDQASKRLALELGREPSEQELASATGVVPNGVAQVLGMVKEPLSLDAPRGPDSEASLGDSVADRAAISPNEHAARRERADRLHGLLDGLSTREREMLRMRFGLDGTDECTLEQIGQSFALTRERVRQIVTAALDKLHHQTQVRRLELEPTAD